MRYLSRFNDDFAEPLFEDFFSPVTRTNRTHDIMRTDIVENDNSYELSIDMPGVNKSDINLSLEQGYLIIEYSHPEENEEKTSNYIRRERIQTSMKRSYYIGNVSMDKISASYQDGVLKISVQKEDKSVPESHSIEIQ